MSRADEPSQQFEAKTLEDDREHEVADGAASALMLTQRQREIVRLVARGLTNEQIAERCVVAAGTVAKHVTGILQSLRLKSQLTHADRHVGRRARPQRQPGSAADHP